MAFTDLRWTGAPPVITAALVTLGHPDFVAADVPSDPRVAAFGPVGILTVAGHLVMFALVRLKEGEAVATPDGAFFEPGALSETATGRFMEVPVPVTYKTDVWMRCSEEEATVLDYALGPNGPATPRMRRMWADCTQVEHNSPTFPVLMEQMAAAFGAPRAAELLAPSVYL
jgi:hypothetical protein